MSIDSYKDGGWSAVIDYGHYQEHYFGPLSISSEVASATLAEIYAIFEALQRMRVDDYDKVVIVTDAKDIRDFVYDKANPRNKQRQQDYNTNTISPYEKLIFTKMHELKQYKSPKPLEIVWQKAHLYGQGNSNIDNDPDVQGNEIADSLAFKGRQVETLNRQAFTIDEQLADLINEYNSL